jgi:hypothetical protein
MSLLMNLYPNCCLQKEHRASSGHTLTLWRTSSVLLALGWMLVDEQQNTKIVRKKQNKKKLVLT